VTDGEAERRFIHVTTAARVLRADGAFGPWNVTDVELLGSLSGDPRGLFVWLIFPRQAEAAAAIVAAEKLTEVTRRLLNDGGYPADAVSTIRVGFTSEEEIERGGGRFLFFR
jgi:hypothetical protein